MKNEKYASKMLRIVQESSQCGFVLSSPSKIAGHEKAAFSMPAGPDFTCPGATPACQGCYAQKGRHIFSTVQKAFAKNWVTMLAYEAADDAAGAAKELLDMIKPNLAVFRIHESGDFYNQFTIDVWRRVAEARPSTAFWFYTRSFHLDFATILALKNVTGWASTDSHNRAAAAEFVAKHPAIRHAYGPLEENERPANTVICPVTSGRLDVEAACKKCRLCTDHRMSKNIGFIKH